MGRVLPLVVCYLGLLNDKQQQAASLTKRIRIRRILRRMWLKKTLQYGLKYKDNTLVLYTFER